VGFALLLLAGSVSAQDKITTTGLLSPLEVQQLMSHGEPGDQARLAAHFTALADRYAADAKRHTAMAGASVGNPSRNLNTGLNGHCRRLATLNTQSAATAREMATYHQQLAKGASATPPSGGGPFHGVPTVQPSDEALSALAANARTAADHQQLQAYFLELAKRYTREAAEHTALARTYRGLPRDPTGGLAMAKHCDQLAATARAEAKEANAAAAMHEALATSAR